MIRYIFVLFLNCIFSLYIYSQNLDNSRIVGNKTILDTNKRVGITTLYGKLEIFPSGKPLNGMEMLLSCSDSLKYYYVNYGLSGEFSLQLDFNGITDINIGFSNPNLRREVPYYPIRIRNVKLNKDSINLGIIPVVVDTFGYYEEWGSTLEKKNYWTITINDMENRLRIESKLNKIYNRICINCKPIFVTEEHKEESKTNFSYSESRKFVIDYHELNLLTNYFNSMITDTISNTKH